MLLTKLKFHYHLCKFIRDDSDTKSVLADPVITLKLATNSRVKYSLVSMICKEGQAFFTAFKKNRCVVKIIINKNDVFTKASVLVS